MTTDVQPAGDVPEPAQLLLEAAKRSASSWLRRVTLAAATRSGVTLAADDPELSAVIDASVGRLLRELAELLDTDVDEQRTNPLSLFRQAVEGPTGFLLARGARAPSVDRFAADHFPDDVFGLGPASWSDVDPGLHEPGITWGAWKAITILRRRRDEGVR